MDVLINESLLIGLTANCSCKFVYLRAVDDIRAGTATFAEDSSVKFNRAVHH